MKPYKNHGFTLLEMMMVVGILSLLAALAIPAYNSYLMRGYMTEAQNNIAALKLAEEEFYIENNVYFYANTTNADLKTASGDRWEATGRDGAVHFDYKVTVAGTSYTITATGKAGTPVAGKTLSETN